MLEFLKMFSLFNPKNLGEALQLAFFMAMLSVVFQQWKDGLSEDLLRSVPYLLMCIGTTIYLVPRYRKYGLWLFVIPSLVSFAHSWFSVANHTWLAIWTMSPAILFPKWWKEEAYATYLRLTIGAVLVLAGVQKIASGHYVDGSYVAWISHHGSATEQFFQFLCPSSGPDICTAYVLLGILAIIWQIVAGLLLLFNFKHFIFILIEVSFLLFVGLYADEMNFQTLNIALLCIALRFGMSRRIALLCFTLLLTDMVTISQFLEWLYEIV